MKEVRRGRSGVPALDPVRRVRRAFDAAELAAQRRPRLARILRRVRRVAIRLARPLFPEGFERRELRQAKVVMADALPQPENGTKVMVVSFRAWTSHVAWETTIAHALRHRGAACDFLYCGGGLPICEIGWRARDARDPCSSCSGYVSAMLTAADFPSHQLSDFVPDHERRAIIDRTRLAAGSDPQSLEVDGLALAPLIEQSLVWYFRAGSLPDTEEVRAARADFLAGAAVVATATQRLLDRIEPEVILMVNGLFFEERIILECARARGIRVVTYEVGHQRGTLFFSDGLPAPEYDISALWDEDGDHPLDQVERRIALEHLDARRGGDALSRRWYRSPSSARLSEPGRPLFALFTNVSWDTAVTGKAIAFETMFDWVSESIDLAREHPEIDLVVRIHPAESRWPGLETKERASDFIGKAFPGLPANVRIIPPEESVDSYALLDSATGVLVFASTIGLEAAGAGKAVAVAGETHYRGRGFTVDVQTRAEYRSLFDDLSWTRDDPRRTELALSYVYLMFHRALLPFGAVIEDEPSEPVFTYESVSELSPGRDEMLDLICDGILHGGRFSRLG